MPKFLLAEPEALDSGEAREPDYPCRRLRQLAKIAAKLAKAGWENWFTIGGLAFMPPDPDDTPVEDRLAEIGIKGEVVSPMTGRTVEEFLETMWLLYRRVWYQNMLTLVTSPYYDAAAEFAADPDGIRGILAGMAKSEQERVEELVPVESEFDWGLVNGRLSALRWLAGEDWENNPGEFEEFEFDEEE